MVSRQERRKYNTLLEKLIFYGKKRLRQLAKRNFDFIRNKFLSKLLSFLNGYGTLQVMKEDWDTLIILDACRYDVFEAIAPYLPFNGYLEKRRSVGSCTLQFLKKSFQFADMFYDTIYISANPFTSHNPYYNTEEKFYKVIEVWRSHWNEKYGTCMAEDVTKVALEIRESYPSKDLIVHYMQPHHPFVGKTKLYHRGGVKGEFGNVKLRESIWNNPHIKEAWKDNLIYIMKKIIPLIENLKEKIVITADHGDSFRFSGHPFGLPLKELIEVPWYVIDKRTKRKELRKKIKKVKKSVQG